MAAPVLAENYQAEVYGLPAGYAWLVATGAGDGGAMTGYSVLTSNQSYPSKSQAFYYTPQGFRNITPANWSGAIIWDSWANTYHAGGGTINGSYPFHALFWIGSGSVFDIHPAGAEYDTSEALGGGGQEQVGYVNGNFSCQQCGFTVLKHAGMWSRTAASFARLHSTTHELTRAMGTDGIQQVGEGRNRSTLQYNALLWNGPNSFAVNLNPAGYGESHAFSNWGTQQTGTVKGNPTGSKYHAALWTGTAASMVDLNPNSIFSQSEAHTVRNGMQVGIGIPITQSTRTQAIAWHGSAATWINLHARLPHDFLYWNSFAEDIDNLGNIMGYVEKNGVKRPVIWRRF
jgi:hypothetical protein